ncbi:MAG TPA: pyridoxal phosphate-dependent aminotransferase [Acidimicrobiales bacterium]|nr:pyridoxal phosphate-dependent aminotransferase [Acidimicrobiales bacterium]
MEMRPFLLDQWLSKHQFAAPPIEYDLASSTGPRWTVRELLALVDDDVRERLFDQPLYYAPAEGGAELREAVAAVVGVTADDVRITTGASEALWILLIDAAGAGANVVLPHPGFPTFAEAAQVLGLEIRHYHLRPESEFRIDLDEIRSRSDRRTKLILVNSPHNPTGAVIGDAELDNLHRFTGQRGIQLVVDEVYHPIYHGPAAPSASRLPGVTVLGDFSKALCLSGLRLGWIIERDAARRARYENARGYLTVSSSSPLGEALGVIGMHHRDRIVERAQRVASANLRAMEPFFAVHAERIGWIPPRGGLTAWPWLRSGESSRPFCEEAAARGVLLAPGDCFGAPSHFRISLGPGGDDISKAVDRLSALVAATLPSSSPSRRLSPAGARGVVGRRADSDRRPRRS